eukprot:scaffold22479_cov63-Phaeocystis_antarctica.AAC.2
MNETRGCPVVRLSPPNFMSRATKEAARREGREAASAGRPRLTRESRRRLVPVRPWPPPFRSTPPWTSGSRRGALKSCAS